MKLKDIKVGDKVKVIGEYLTGLLGVVVGFEKGFVCGDICANKICVKIRPNGSSACSFLPKDLEKVEEK